MNRFIYLSCLVLGAAGSVVIWKMAKTPLIAGWWIGIVLGLLNFAFLLKTIRPTNSRFQASFFIRYLLLALAFFLIIQFGRDQLGSALISFVSLYAILFFDYLVKLKKQKK